MARKPAQVPGAAPEQSDEAPAAATEQPNADLPNAIDIDPKAIKAPVLTRQGWVCPLEQPREGAPR